MSRRPRKRRLRITGLAALGALVLAPALAAAQQPPAPEAPAFTLGVGARTWVSTGYTTWSFKGAGIDPLSELRLRGTDSVIVEGNADLVWKRLVLMTSIGRGAITDEPPRVSACRRAGLPIWHRILAS